MRTVAVVSGGMDSVTLAHYLVDAGHDLTIVAFDYGQRHNKELEFARMCAERLEASFQRVDLTSITGLLAGSSLTSPSVPVPDGHYAEETMKATVVPNRNAIMISIAVGLAVSISADHVAVGVHGGDHFIYPDCRPEFVNSMQATILAGNEGSITPEFSLLAPFISGTKSDIAREGVRLQVPWVETWSCYKGGEIHCGACGTCVERREAMIEAGIEDPTEYAALPVFEAP